MTISLLRPPPAHTLIPILHEASNFCIVGKPAGIMVHRNKFSKKGEDGVALLQRVRDQLGRHVHPVHRLDGGTSGCLVFAYDGETCAMLQRAAYLALLRASSTCIQPTCDPRTAALR